MTARAHYSLHCPASLFFLLLLSLFWPLAASAEPQKRCKEAEYCQIINYQEPNLVMGFQNISSTDLSLILEVTLDPDTDQAMTFTRRQYVRAGETAVWLNENIGLREVLNLTTFIHRIEGPEELVPERWLDEFRDIAGPYGLSTEASCQRPHYCIYQISKPEHLTYVLFKKHNVPLLIDVTVSRGETVNESRVVEMPGPAGIAEIFTVPANRSSGAAVTITSALFFGYGNAKDTERDYVYRLPYASGESFRISQGYGGAATHFEEKDWYSLDWAMPIGTPIHAARGGIVIKVNEDETRSGAFPELLTEANVIRILHDDGTIAMYAHLDTDGAKVIEGAYVKAGDVIGYSGNTGFSTGPHLHFSVKERRAPDEPLMSIPTRFRAANGDAVLLETGDTLTAP